MIVERITQSIGEPKLNPDRLTADSHSQHVEGKPLLDIIRYLGDDDSISRIMVEKTLTRRKSMPTT
ncbi:MAG: hypothetical protein ACRD4C_06350 [Candidatus Acidiferrales bacterium]